MVASSSKNLKRTTRRPEPKTRRKSILRRSRLAEGLGAPKIFQMDHEKWEALGKTINAALTQDDRDSISSIINEYLYWEAFESSAPACVDEAGEIKRVRSEALRLREALYKPGSPAATNALIKISSSYQSRSKLDVNAYEIFRRSLLKLIASCDEEARNLNTEPGWETGISWEIMLGEITKYFKEHNYKTGARQDGPTSPFVEFIWKLHQYIQLYAAPNAYIRGLMSEESLAKAIHRARRADKLSKKGTS